jgi:hypothetical protein
LRCEPGSDFNSYRDFKALGLSETTIDRLKKHFAEEGLYSDLGRKSMDLSSRNIKYDGALKPGLLRWPAVNPLQEEPVGLFVYW